MTWTSSNGSTGAGGVDDDGTFWMGSADRLPELTSNTLVNGKFELSGETPASATGVMDGTVTGVVGDTNLDCDLRVSLSLRYEGP